MVIIVTYNLYVVFMAYNMFLHNFFLHVVFIIVLEKQTERYLP